MIEYSNLWWLMPFLILGIVAVHWGTKDIGNKPQDPPDKHINDHWK